MGFTRIKVVVTVKLENATETIAVLHARQQHLLQLRAAAARVELDGQGLHARDVNDSAIIGLKSSKLPRD